MHIYILDISVAVVLFGSGIAHARDSHLEDKKFATVGFYP